MVVIGAYDIIYINSENKKTVVHSNELPYYITEDVKFEGDITFMRIFDLIIINKKIFNTIFAHLMGFSEIDDFIWEYDEPFNESDDDLSYLEIGWCTDYDSYDNEDHKDLHIYNYFNGKKNNNDLDYSITETPLNQLKKYKIVLNNSFIIRHPKRKKDKNDKTIRIIDSTQNLTVYDLIKTILSELITFKKQ